MGVACGDRRCAAVIASFAPAAVLTVAFVLVASFIALKLLFAGDRWNLGNELPGPLPMTLYGFGIGFFGSLMGERRRDFDHHPYGLRQADPQCGRHFVGRRRADHGCRRDRLVRRRPARTRSVAAALARIRVAHRTRRDRSGRELRCAVRRASRAPAAAPHARNRIRPFSCSRCRCGSW